MGGGGGETISKILKITTTLQSDQYALKIAPFPTFTVTIRFSSTRFLNPELF